MQAFHRDQKLTKLKYEDSASLVSAQYRAALMEISDQTTDLASLVLDFKNIDIFFRDT